jgi:hypothetical protein
MNRFLLFVAAIFLIIIVFAAILVPFNLADGNKEPPVYVGISFCGNTPEEAKLLIDKVFSYTNLFVLQSYPISRNETAVKEICDYAVKNDLYIIINLGTYNKTYWPWQFELFCNGSNLWGSHFLGAYYDDEPGGIQLDYNWDEYFTKDIPEYLQMLNETGFLDYFVKSPLYQVYLKYMDYKSNGTKPQNYDLETEAFLYYFNHIDSTPLKNLTASGVKTFTSDYAMYWYDYLGGYDVMLTQLGWNSSYIRDIDFIRGAANLQNKEWGAIITWKYTEKPYLDSGVELYNQMLTAYQAGAKYIIIFNYPQIDDNPYGTMTDEHFRAIEQFSNDVMTTSTIRTSIDVRTADAVLVLPHNYGWGMRYFEDKIWGYWEPDEISPQIWNITCRLLLQYRLNLDIVYDDTAYPVAGKYTFIYYWNQTL